MTKNAEDRRKAVEAQGDRRAWVVVREFSSLHEQSVVYETWLILSGLQIAEAVVDQAAVNMKGLQSLLSGHEVVSLSREKEADRWVLISVAKFYHKASSAMVDTLSARSRGNGVMQG